MSWKRSHKIKISVSWDVTQCNRALYTACFMIISCLAYYSNLKVEETCSSEMPIYFRWTTRNLIPEDRTTGVRTLNLRTKVILVYLYKVWPLCYDTMCTGLWLVTFRKEEYVASIFRVLHKHS
jgi:hypothetical protein